MYRPPCSNVQLLAVVSDFTLPEVSGVDFPQLVQTVFAQCNLDARYKVIAVQQSSRTIQTGVASSDRCKFQCLKTLPLIQVNAAVLCIGSRDLYSRKNIVEKIFSLRV